MAKVVFKTTPKAAYEWADVEGGSSMTDMERKAFLDEYIEDNGLVPVESDFVGESPVHRYGRYKVGGAPAAALAPTSLAGQGEDLVKTRTELDQVKAKLARAMAQLGKASARAKNVITDMADGMGTAGAQDTTDALAVLNAQDGVSITPGQEVREDMSTADRSDDNPVVGTRRGRPPKAN